MGRREIAQETARLDRRIADYLAGLDEAPSSTAAVLQALRERRAELDRLAAKLDVEARTMLVEGEPDARPMGIGFGRKPPSYIVQTALCVPANRAVNNQGDGTLFDRSLSDYDGAADSYRCPAGRTLVRKQIMRRDNCVLYAAQDCSGCALKPAARPPSGAS